MFESSLIALDQKKQPGRRWLSLPLAIVLHLAVLVSLTFAQYWNVEKVTEPEVVNIVFHPDPPAPPPIARGTSAPQPTPHRSAAPVPARQVVQPPPVVPDLPPAPAAPEPAANVATDDRNLLPGPTTGDPNGVDGGDPNGVLNGKGPIGSTGHGFDQVDAPPIPVGGAVTKPVILRKVEPQYTEVARRARLQGTVIVQAVIDEAGRVLDVKVLKPLPMGLDQAAVDAVSQWRFTPATLYGRPVKVYFSLTVNFKTM
jgi:periplasmic protein TonB